MNDVQDINDSKELITNISSLFNSKEYSDFIVLTNDKVEFYCHKLILSLRK
jgi:hypothetical protein